MSAVVSLDAQPPSLPPTLTPLLGREADLDRLLALIDAPANRLVTITGPGGVGKTRLALHLARTLIDEFGREVVFVPLAAISDPDLVLPAIAQALGVETPPGALVEGCIAASLAGRTPLLVLDNFEQVLAGAPAVASLLAHCPTATVLVTSRAALGIPGEHRAPLAPLPTPLPGQQETGAILRAESAALFVARARAVNPDLAVDDRTAVAIGEICRRLDGLPLAIELAAARVNILSPQALLARLDNRLQVLGGDRRGVPDRLKTMRNAIAWSYDLLAPREQALFRRLSVFAGGWPLEAVEAIFPDGEDVVDALGALVDHSLVLAVPQAAGETRYAMLETLREYGLEQLAAHGEAQPARAAHASFIVNLAEAAEPHLIGGNQAEWLHRLEAEWDNIRAACDWALATGRPDLPMRIFGAIWRFSSSRGHTTESRTLLDRALTDTGSDEGRLRCRALIAAGNFAEDQRDMEAARSLLVQARDLATRIGSGSDEVRALIGLAHEAHGRGDYAAATASSTRAIARAREIGDHRGLASALGAMGNIKYFQGNLPEAQRYWEEARQIVADMGDRQAEAMLLGNMGAVASSLGEFERAVELQERALALGRAVNDVPAVAYALINLAEQLRFLGDYARAEASVVEGLALLHDIGFRGTEAEGMHIHAALVFARGDSRRAASLVLPAIERFAETGDLRNLSESVDLVAEMCLDQGEHVAAIELLAAAGRLRQEIGVELIPVKVRELAELRSRLHRAVRDADYHRHWRMGQRLDLDALVAKTADMTRAIGATTAQPPTTPAPPDPLDALSAREMEVMRLLVDGRTAREIGGALFISPRTVTTHINNIYGKLNVSTRGQAVAVALRAGLE